ncbi:MAG: adenylate/guanylate cyclase domain-containing protein, partial [Chloroflexota bacterium]|nr:adenylate/guanylate cyclase domain-containing protein [Chloroflexota bacterium]
MPQCPNCGFESRPEMEFCGMCGTRLTQTCSHCGLTSPLDYRFCGHCGLAFELGLRSEQPSPGVPVPPQTLGEDTPVGEVIHTPNLVPSPSPSAQPATSTLTGERRPATIIIADVKGSTDLMEQIGTEAWVEIMNRVLQILAAEVTRFGGEVDQFRGDGLVALFGVKSAHEDDPERALLSALAMQRSLKTYAADLAESEGIELLLRVGVNTGEVIAANIGDRSQHSEDTAMGGAIAIAARLESAAEPGTVLVSGNTYRLVKTQFEWEPLGKINVRGIKDPVEVYRPLLPQAESEQLRRLRTLDTLTPMIGRDAEFMALRGGIEDLRDERGGVVLLSGARGMGKSLMVAQARQYLLRQEALLATTHESDFVPPASITWLHGRCRSYYQSWPYSMWIDLIRSWLGMRPEQPDEEIGDHLQRQTEALWGHQPADVDQILVDFPSIVEESFSHSVEYLNAEEPRQRFFQAVRSWLQAMARRGPVVLDFGDMQWADKSSLDLLKYCLPLCDQESILWLLVFRPDRESSVWGFSHFVETEYPHRLIPITLPPLDTLHSEKFIARMIGPGVLPDETRNLILSKAEGNPYFIRELIHSLMSQGILARDDTGNWRSTQAVDSLDLPDSLQSVFLAYIDRLTPEERYVLQLSAVIGRVFWYKVLAELIANEEEEVPKLFQENALSGYLTALQRTQLIAEDRRTPDLGREYIFQSPLVHDAVYESLLTTRRNRYHLQAAEYLEEILDEDARAQYYGLIAYHYSQAGEHGRELSYTLLAAEQA